MNTAILTAIISVCAAMSGMILGWSTRARDVKRETKSEAASSAFLKADVEYIKRGVDDIRIEQRALGQQFDALSERVTRCEESTKQAHKRLDGMER